MFKYPMIAFALSCLLLPGCSQPPALANDTGKAKIIILFPKERPDSKLATPLVLSGRTILAAMPAGTYCEIPVTDGEYSLQAGEGSPDQNVVPPKIDVIISAGSTKYIELSAQSSFKDGQPVLTIVPALISGAAALGKLSGLKKVSP